VKANKEGKPQLHQNTLLALGVLNFVALDDRLFVEHLHGEDLSTLLVANEQNLEKSGVGKEDWIQNDWKAGKRRARQSGIW